MKRIDSKKAAANIVHDFKKSGKQVLVILGPTASGKSGVGVEAAKLLGGEVISTDSRQVYVGMDVGTGKVTTEEKQGVPHYMLDICEPKDSFSVGDYKEQVEDIIANLLKNKKVPIIVGGTGLYINALVLGYTFGVASDAELRSDLENELKDRGEEALYGELREKDPEAYNNLEKGNTRYLLRALEVIRSGEKKSSEKVEGPSFSYFLAGLAWDKEDLNERINVRHEAMFDNDAIIKETKSLLEKGYTFDMESMSSIGYREVGQYLDGEISKEEAIAKVQQGARKYAKRQRTWFRRLERSESIEWYDATTYFVQ